MPTAKPTFVAATIKLVAFAERKFYAQSVMLAEPLFLTVNGACLAIEMAGPRRGVAVAEPWLLETCHASEKLLWPLAVRRPIEHPRGAFDGTSPPIDSLTGVLARLLVSPRLPRRPFHGLAACLPVAIIAP